MKLLGRDISGAALLDVLQERLRARGLTEPADASANTAGPEGVAPPVDPLRFNLRALEEHADPTRPVPLHTHRAGLTGRLVLLSKRLAQRGGRVLLASALERQRIFNGHVRDSYAQLSADVLRLTAQVERLNARLGASPPTHGAGAPKPPPPGAATSTRSPRGAGPKKPARGAGPRKADRGAASKGTPRGGAANRRAASTKSPRGGAAKTTPSAASGRGTTPAQRRR